MENFYYISNNYKNQKSIISSYAQKKQLPFFKPFIQPKLTINQPNDSYEQEADAMVNRVMRMKDDKPAETFFKPVILHIQKKCEHCEKEEKVQMKGESGINGGTAAPPNVNDVINSSGQPLDVDTRGFMESRFGYDFGSVQIHNDAIAHQSSKDINALAYTHGNHVVFDAGKYQPETNAGKQLLAHELMHVVQQKGREGMIQRLVRESEVKGCKDQSDKPSNDLLAAEQRAFDLLRKGIDKIQVAEDEYRQAVHKYISPTIGQLKEFKEAFEMGKSLRSAFGVSADRTESWDKLHIIKIRFMEVLRYLDQVVFQYVCLESGDMCPERRFAFVDTNKDHRTINLCPKFWDSSLRERGSTLAHEIMHLWGGGFMKDTTEEVFGITKVTPRFQDVNRYEKFLLMITS